MKRLSISVLVLALGFAFSAGSMAEDLSRGDYQAGNKRIAAGYRSAKARCAALAGNKRDICMAKTQGTRDVALAELHASYKPSPLAHFQAHMARTRADYAVARERCDERTGNAKVVCVRKAKAAATAARADARAQLKTSEAIAADEKAGDAHTKATSEAAVANKDAAAEKRDARYGVAKQKCDGYAGVAKDRCIDEARARFGKS